MSTLPLSGQVLGTLLRAIGQSADDLEHELPVTGRRARVYFGGGRVAAETRGEVVRLVVRKVMAHLGGRSAPASTEPLGEVEAGIAEILERWSDNWDRLVTHWRVIQPSGVAGLAVSRAALRLVTVDTVVRAAGVALMTGAQPPSELPRWGRWAATASGASGLLRDLKARAGLSVTDLADNVGYQWLSDSAIKTHLEGAHRPGNEHVLLLARALAASLAEPAQAVALDLRRHYAIHALLGAAAEGVGWDLVAEASSFAVKALHAMTDALRRPQAQALAGSLLAEGAWTGASAPLIELLMQAAPDARWREAILGATRDWFGFLRYEATRVQRLGEAPFEALGRPGSAKAWGVAGHFALAQVQQDAAIACFRKAVELDETVPEHHLDLADFLPDEQPTAAAMRRACEEARHHARRALEIRSGWPAAQITMALLIQELEGDRAAERYLDAIDLSVMDGKDAAIIAYDRAALQFQQDRFRPALAILKRLLKRQTTHGAALELAARCCAAIGNQAEARQYAERARAVGIEVCLSGQRS